ncbi:cysteine-rich receptor-like protein kinase 2 isoform X2 [Prosopis cineraria]|uniref:cysteine-rich receptor-like protein kinase 2 isoform X2 n=1 Tax=Prosopis cineraria TaxID=364024 RepID=UPI00240F7778|nr:cysteine-rich receptor-like protein kinase 2 isoform X2 [Prosopis cineraria]
MQPQLQQKPLFFFVFLSFIIIWSWGTLDGVVSDPQTNLVRLWCDQDGDNDGSILKEILNETFRDLRAQIEDQSKLFGTAQAVKANIAVYGLFQCRNYLSIADCLACFNVAAVNIRNCSARAYGARLVYDGCFLRYESTQEFDQASESWNNIRCGNQTLKDSPALASTVQQVLTNLGTATPRMPGFYAATKTAVPNSNGFSIYAIAQCVETLSQSGCQNCIDTASGKFQTCLTTSNAESYDTGCFMRYSTNAFFSDNQTTDINGFLKKQGSSNKAFIIGIVIGGLMLFLILLIALFARIRPRKSPKRVPKGDITGISQLKAPVNYNYKDLKSATKNFSLENKLGEGGFGAVYKGTLKNGKVVAVKKLTLRQSKRVEEEFESEVKLISNVHHRNLVRLLGCCSRGNKRILVYEYMEKTSLDRFLFDDDLQPKIADFGLARLLPEDKTHLNTRFAGTLGYTAPEYAIHGQLSEKVDVYSYGVVILEIISGRRNNELNVNGAAEGEFLLQQAWKLYKRGIHIELVDDTLDPNDYDVEEVKKIIEIGLLCTQGSVEIRPKMSEVVALLQQKGLSEDMRPTMPILIEIN